MTQAAPVNDPSEAAGGAFQARTADLLALGGVLLVAALLRLPGLIDRAGWDADQGSEMLVLWRLVYEHIVPLVGPPTSIGDLHHGVLYYFLLAPFAFISGDDPVVIAWVIGVAGVAAVGVTWWLARAIGGPVAGVVAGLVMAVSASAIAESSGIWNPHLIALAASVALAGAWRAHETGKIGWWALAAAGFVVTVQCHILGIALAPPLAALYLLDLRRASGPDERNRLLRAGLVAVAVIVLGYAPLIVHELGNGFPELRSVIAFLTGGGQPVAMTPPERLVFVGMRILAWPVAGLITDQPLEGAVLAVIVVGGLGWRLHVADRPERGGVWFLAGTLLFGWLFLALGVGALTTVTVLPVDHYHAFLDPIIFIAVGLTAAGLWRITSVARATAVVGVAALLAFNLSLAPPAQSADGGWNAADVAAQRILMTTGNRPIELRSLPAFKAPDAYGFPLIWLHARVSGTMDTPTAWTTAVAASAGGSGAIPGDVPAAALASGGAIVTICDSLFVATCGGTAEVAAVPATGFELALRFTAAPGRTISVYLPDP